MIDPRTGRPVTGSLRIATALGETCLAADAATTATLVLGDDAVAWLSDPDVIARLTHVDGAVTRLATGHGR